MSKTDSVIGARIKSRRSALKISQTKLADAIGVRFQQVQKYESGTNRVSASRLLAIADFLNVPVSYFFQGLDGQGSEEDEPAKLMRLNALSNARVAEILALLETIPAEQQHAVLAFLRSLASTRNAEQVA